MSGALKRSTRWKNLERTAARKLRGKRIVRVDLFEVAPDVLVDDFGIIVDAKAHKRFRHHALLDAVALKYCRPGEVPCLVTKTDRQVGEYCTLPLDFVAAILDELRHARLNVRIRRAEIEGDHEALGEAMREKLALRRARHDGT